MKLLFTFILCLLFCFLCLSFNPLPNNAEYFWCSQLYNPYYPLNPFNVSLPFINITHTPNNPPEYISFLERSLYFNNENNATIWAKVNENPINASSSLYITIEYNSIIIGQSAILINNLTSINIIIDSLPINSSSIIQCNFYQDNNLNILYYSNDIILNRYSNYNQQVYINYKSKGIYVNDKPWIPVGFYYPFSSYDKLEAIFIDEIHNGMQTPLPYRPPTPFNDTFYDFLSLANRVGARVHIDLYELSEQPNSQSKWNTLNETIQGVKDKEGILAYYIADEPDGAGFGLDPELLKEVYDYIKQEDPYHPVTLVLNCVNSAPRYVDCADIIMMDPYPIGLSQPVGCDHCIGNPLDIANRVDLIISQINNTKPVWVVIQAFGGPNEHWDRLPTWQEERAMSYLSIIHGAKGIQYFLEGLPFSRAVWAECRKISLELNAITPAILSVDNPPTIIVSTNQIHASGYMELSKTCVTILVANSINTPTEFSIYVEELSNFSNLTINVLFENRNIFMINGKFTEYINGYGTHIYRLYYNSNPLIFPDNIIKNPSFEIQNNIGMADSMWITSTNPSNVGLIDPIRSYDGYYSQRLTNSCENKFSCDSITLSTYIIPIQPNILHRLTFEAFSFDYGIEVTLSSPCLSKDTTYEVSLTGLWIEGIHHFEIEEPKQCSFSLTLKEKGTIWIDIFQIVPQDYDIYKYKKYYNN